MKVTPGVHRLVADTVDRGIIEHAIICERIHSIFERLLMLAEVYLVPAVRSGKLPLISCKEQLETTSSCSH